MEMKNALARPSPTVNHHTVTVLRNPLLLRQLIGDGKNFADQLFILLLDIEQRGEVLARDDQDVNRRLGVNILKRNNGTVLIDDAPF